MIAYVDSPFQLLQCYEIQSSGIFISKIYIRLNEQVENNNQLTSLVALLELKQAKLIKVRSLFDKLYYYSIFLFLASVNDKFVVGDANSFLFRLMSKFYFKDKFLLLDDGVATILNVNINKGYQRFTIFPKHVANPIVNNFKAIKKINSSPNPERMHIIVGAKFVDAGICTESSYDNLLARAIGGSREELFVYIAHRGESEEQLQRLKNKFSFKILRTKYPIELITYETNIYPESISHVLSTAVFSMNKIYDGVPIYTSKIQSNYILKRNAAIEFLYDEIEKEGFSIFI